MGQDMLKHVGVLGMRWGHRKDRSSKKGPAHPDHEDAREMQKRGVKNLSTMELKRLNNRLQLEKTYKELQPPSKLSKNLKRLKSFNSTVKAVDESYKIFKPDDSLAKAVGRSSAAKRIDKALKKAAQRRT